jgi:hypothetical protein
MSAGQQLKPYLPRVGHVLQGLPGDGGGEVGADCILLLRCGRVCGEEEESEMVGLSNSMRQ